MCLRGVASFQFQLSQRGSRMLNFDTHQTLENVLTAGDVRFSRSMYGYQVSVYVCPDLEVFALCGEGG